MATERLYYTDSYTLRFTARVIEHTHADDRAAVVLDRSYFYPESGGQPPDLGTLNEAHVIDVQVRESDQAVLHFVDRLPAADGDPVHGQIDGRRRMDLMRHHSAQHILSAALEKAADALTVSVHMGLDSMTIDVNRPPLGDRALADAEALANQIVLADKPIRAYYPDPADIPALKLRKLPDVAGRLRVVDVAEGFDVTACGGTHVARTGEVGPIKIVRQEKFKGGARLEFKAAERALGDYAEKNALLLQLAGEMTTSYTEVVEGYRKLRDEARALRSDLKMLREAAVAREANDLVTSAETVGGVRLLRLVLSGRTIDDARLLIAASVALGNVIVLVGIPGDKAQLIFGRSDDVAVDLVPVLKAALAVIGSGRGGGRPASAQGGGVPASEAQVSAALHAAEQAIRAHF